MAPTKAQLTFADFVTARGVLNLQLATAKRQASAAHARSIHAVV
jgi:hypothetical protein